MTIIFYIASIVAANIVTAKLGGLALFGGALIVPAGSLVVGLTFMLRDFVQLKHGRRGAYVAIVFALVLSAVMSLVLGDTVHIAAASAMAFFMSEAIDTEIFTRLRRSLLQRVAVSGIVGGVVDSSIFVVAGLSPWGAGLIGWGQVLPAIAGQITAKTVTQLAVVSIAATKTK